LVLGGGGLMAAFPLAYAIILPALYAPMIAMLLGLVLRGVAFEFRGRDPNHRARWDAGFCIGSIVATFAQGVTLGALLQGIKISGRAYAGGYWDWITPFSIYTPFLSTKYYETWFTSPGIGALAVMPIAVAAIGLMLYRRIGEGRDFLPFALTLSLFGLSLLGLAISLWPDVIPSRLSIWDAAAPKSSQRFMLVGVCILMPMILAYTAWAYWVFRGKVAEEGYH
jgi:cytochrome bd ubiquinol oxidase subunit II